MNFDEAAQLGNLKPMLDEEFGKWGTFSKESADLALQIAQLEKISPSVVLFTHLNEATFDLRPVPNTNNQPGNVWAWDVGTFQLNVGWTCKSIWVGEFSGAGLRPNDVLGMFSGPTARFDGDPLSNGRLAARKILSIRGDEATQVIQYTGPRAQDARRRNWNKYGSLFKNFFNNYSGAN